MFITTENKCTFKIDFLSLSSVITTSKNNILWESFNHEDSNVIIFKNEYEKYLWERLLNDHPKDRFKNKTRYNPYTNDTRRIDNDGLFVYDDDDDNSNKNNNNDGQISQYISDCLIKLTKYKKCVQIVTAIMTKEGFKYEPFQLSILYEHLFFYINEHDPGVLQYFIYAMYPYFMFNIDMVDHVIRMYTKKHYVSIIPRRHGKTLIIYAVIASFLLAFRKLNILAVAQTKNLIINTKKRVIAYIDFWIHNFEEDNKIIISYPTPDNAQIEFKDYPQSGSLLICVSAHNDNSLRGPDPQICIVDETMCIKADRFNSILPFGQKKHCKIGCLSSPTPQSKELLLQFCKRLSQEYSGTNFYHINYFCGSPKHLKYTVSQDGCVNLIFYKPRHITFTQENKTLTEIMTSSTICYDSELGIIKEDEFTNDNDLLSSDSEDTRAFSPLFYDYFKTHNMLCYETNCDTFFIYLDPAFNATPQSGCGITCTGFNSQKLPVIYYLNHKYIAANELISTNNSIQQMMEECVRDVCNATNGKAKNFFMCIENNSHVNDIAVIYRAIIEKWDPYKLNGFLYHMDGRKVNEHIMFPGYCMTTRKRTIFKHILTQCNTKQFKVSAYLPCYHNIRKTHPLEYLLSECKTFRWVLEKRSYDGKIKRNTTDDLVIAFIMSIYFCITYRPHLQDFLEPKNNKTQSYPWIPIKRNY